MRDSIIANLITFVITFALGFGSSRLQIWFKGRRKKKFLRRIFGIYNGKVLICHTGIMAENKRINVPLGDTDVSLKIKMELINAGLVEDKDIKIIPHFKIVKSDKIVSGSYNGHSLIIVGGPKHNKVAECFFNQESNNKEAVNIRYIMQYENKSNKNIIKDLEFNTIIRDQMEKEIDFGLFVSKSQKLRGFTHCTIIAGIHGAGTRGTQKELFKNNNLEKIYYEMKNGSVVKLCKVYYMDGYDGDIDETEFI